MSDFCINLKEKIGRIIRACPDDVSYFYAKRVGDKFLKKCTIKQKIKSEKHVEDNS